MMNLSAYSDLHEFIVRPASGKGVVTVEDQRAMKCLITLVKRPFVVVPFNVKRREEIVRFLKSVRFSKPMSVTEITDRQWSTRFKMEETIPGTGIAATKKQLADTFVVGKKVA